MGATSQNKELFEDYDGFVEKFEAKKTTDDCYTPAPIYEAIAQWACREYGVDYSKIVRPFYPGGDYERYDYPDGCCVLDNPPFSILAKIVRFYDEHGIDYFLFAPTLTLLSVRGNTGRIAVNCTITYANGAKVSTSFVSNLEPAVIRSAPDLFQIIKRINDQITDKKRPNTVYEYPPDVLIAARVGVYSRYGIDYRVMPDECIRISELDEQKAEQKAIFGGGLLLSEKAAAKRTHIDEVCEQARARANKPDRTWTLSARERLIQQKIGRKIADA